MSDTQRSARDQYDTYASARRFLGQAPLSFTAWKELKAAGDETAAKPLTFTLTVRLPEDATVGEIATALTQAADNMSDLYGAESYPFAGQGSFLRLRDHGPKQYGKWGVDTAE